VYGKSLERSFITRDLAVIGKGLEAFAVNMLGGGLGLAAGTAISKCLPMSGDWLMTRSAKNKRHKPPTRENIIRTKCNTVSEKRVINKWQNRSNELTSTDLEKNVSQIFV
jgi:hypothetical protein